ncbi:MAG: hypothetical protein V1837_07200 [Candidatus Woesearchaeota archaeon]
MKKAMEMLGTIITSVLVIVAIFVMILLFTGKIGITKENLSSCTTKNGECVKTAEECSGGTALFDCPSSKPVCCIKP